MSSALIADALSKVWCVPDPHNQVILQPARITPDGGILNTLYVGWENISLPNLTSRFHVYQIGQTFPVLVEMDSAANTWQTLGQACTSNNIIFDVYTASGIQVPRTRTYYRYTSNKNILLAVEMNTKLQYDFNDDPVFFRAYRNSFYQNPALSLGKNVVVQGGIMTSATTITTLQTQIATIIGSVGYSGGLYIFINGYKQPTVNLATVRVGDVAEFVYDPSIYKVADFQISTLPTFVSTLDSMNKYLLHYSGASDGYIDYVGNIDIFIIDSTTQKGVYVNKNVEKTLRQVTYKDYSIPTSFLTGYFDNFKNENGQYTISNLYLRLHIRYSGTELVPIADANFTNYLMKLHDSQIVSALVGTNATIPLWTAPNLEASAYPKLMRSSFNQITSATTEAAYGYAQANLSLAANLLPVSNVLGSLQVNIPVAFVSQCTAFEYDANGLLLGFHSVAANALIYVCTSSIAAYVELVEGIGSNQLDETYGMVNTTITPNSNYHYYAYVGSGYQDVTAQSYYTVTNGVSSWNSPSSIVMSSQIVRSDKRFLLYTATLNPTDGLLVHQLTYTQNTLGGQVVAALPVPLGELDVWLNGYSLVPGIDYIFKFPTICIISKTHLASTPGPQTLTIRYTGFCDTDLKQLAHEEIGYVYTGLLSADSRYHLHENRLQKITVGGSVISQASARFAETSNTGTLTNGLPYRIRDVINPLNGYVKQDPYLFYKTSKINSKAVSDYLSTYIPTVLPSPVNPIPAKYRLYSPFIGKIVADLASGALTNPVFATQYPDSTTITICSAYTYLLQLDPLLPANTPSMNYCSIEPTWLNTTITLTSDQFRFITNVVRIYANGLINLSPLVSI